MKFWHEVFSENGEGSFSRVCSGVVIGSGLGWITFLVLKNGQMPDLGGVTLFITGIVGILYGINKAPAIAGAITGNQSSSKTN